MNKIITKVKKTIVIKLSILAIVSLFAQTSLFAQSGKDLFKANCSACHNVTAARLVGPGLEGVTNKRSKEWFMKWVKNSTEFIASGDADAKAIFDEFKIPMPPQNLTDEQLTLLYDYLANPNAEVTASAGTVTTVSGATEQELLGEKLFKTICSACHSIGDNKIVGPGLKGVCDRRSEEWIIKWVTNSADLIASGDADAKAVFEQNNKIPMPAQALSPDEIKAVIAYIKNPPQAAAKVDTPSATQDVVAEDGKESTSSIFIILIIIIVILIPLIIFLNKPRVNLAKLAAEKEGVDYVGPTTFIQSVKHTISKNKGVVAVLIIILFFTGLVKLMDGAFTIGVHTGFKPEQPIKFSHKVHAGDNKIDCNYCHSSARKSKTSGIPSLNVCMNCHKYIDGSNGKTFMYNGAQFSMTDEVKKLYQAIDYDTQKLTYGNNPTPVKWIKVHNLPDHAFFSHAQHVTMGKQACQTCHGDVAKMDVVEQFAPLTMKWCIQCHDNTGVNNDGKGNGYYEEMHKRMTQEYKDKWLGDGKLTVAEMGGWECAKCHY